MGVNTTPEALTVILLVPRLTPAPGKVPVCIIARRGPGPLGQGKHDLLVVVLTLSAPLFLNLVRKGSTPFTVGGNGRGREGVQYCNKHGKLSYA